MTSNRSFAPPDEAGEAAPHPFPMWPFAFTAYAEHCSRDYGGYLERLAKADDALAVIRAEEALGLDLLSDINQAFYAMVWAPFGAVMKAGTEPAPPTA